ncbi:hypothetical protein ACHQM5_022097 [Ranunculus cassubicifolius]
MKKKVDERIRTLIENGVKCHHRSMFVIVGDKSRDQIVNLHHLLNKATTKSRPSVLWCYKNELDISSHRRKRVKQIKKLTQRGLLDPEKVDPFLLFLETGGIKYCMYKDSEKILGNTFGMCILQDFEALTPNLLARTIETVEGGGLVILLLRSLSSLTSLYTMAMDVHERFRTESHFQPTGRFNERFLLSIASCKACVVIDDELNILQISSHIRSIKPVPVQEDSEGLSEAQRELKNLKEQLQDDFPVGPLIKNCCTLDQGKAVMIFLGAIMDKTLRNTVALIAARGRGKSAALGLAISGAIELGYSNIFVTAPSPDNLKTLFEFVLKGLDVLEYKEHTDYDVVRSSNSDSKKTIVRLNINKRHRQTIQYIQPHEHEKLSQVELLVIDEAAAIPLPVVKSLIGPYLIFLSSTVNGYEGTGRSLSLKLLQQLEEQSRTPSQLQNIPADGSLSGRTFKKVELTESIRYASGDPIESWLNGLLCLDVTSYIPPISRLPPRSECDLYYVNRDTLFSYHKESEIFLQQMMALYVSSHYKNSPNDLQLMADAPAHHLFVLLGPVDESNNKLPDILCVIQVSLEGQISRKSAMKSLSQGHSPYGDQIPWKFCEQFQDTVFPSLSGARIVRIAVHPSAMRLGYGSTAVELLTRYYEGQLTPITELEDMEEDVVEGSPATLTEAAEKVSLLEEKVKPRQNLPPLLLHPRERKPEKLHYLGVSFGMTLDLLRFWRKHKFLPFYIGQIPTAVTGEHTCMVIKPLNNDDVEVNNEDEWGFFTPFYQDFRNRFIGLLGSSFQKMDYRLCMSILDPKIDFREADPTSDKYLTSLDGILTAHDMKRLETYTNNLADFHLILDLLPKIAYQYFQERIPVSLTITQASILLCMGLKNQDLSYMEREMTLERQQILSQFIKSMKKLYKYLYNVAAEKIEATLPRLRDVVMTPHNRSVDDDLNAGAKEVKEKMKSDSEAGLLNPELLQKYVIADGEVDFTEALQNGGGKLSSSGVISVKSNRSQSEKREKSSSKDNQKSKEKKHDKSGGSGSKRKRKT